MPERRDRCVAEKPRSDNAGPGPLHLLASSGARDRLRREQRKGNIYPMVSGRLQILVRTGRIVACTALLVACASVQNNPINQRLAEDSASVAGPAMRGIADTAD